MSLSLAIAINVIADLAILGLLAVVMSRASVLRPHRPAIGATVPKPTPSTRRRHQPVQAGMRTRPLALSDHA